MNFDRFSPDGNVHFLPASIDDFKERTEPVHARFYSAHFCFTLGQFALEVQHDPDYYFHGEEIFRQDANPDEIRNMKNDVDGYCKLWRSFETDKKPAKWYVWPHSQEHGWCNRLEGTL